MKYTTPTRLITVAALAIMVLTACDTEETTTLNSTLGPSIPETAASPSQEEIPPLELPEIDENQVARYYIVNGELEEHAKPMGRAEGDLLLSTACSSASGGSLSWNPKVGSDSEEGGEVVCGDQISRRVIQAVAGDDITLDVFHGEDPSMDAYVSVTPFN